MLKTIIIDDKSANISTLCSLVEIYCPQVSICTTSRDIEDGYAAIVKFQPDLIFLDIEMPKGNGFDLLKRFEQLTFDVIFTTAYSQYAVQAFRENALDYLLKPIEIDALRESVARAQEKASLQLLRNNQYLEKYLAGLHSPGNLNKISIPVLDGYLFINPRDIIRCEASGSYSYFFMTDGKQLLVSMQLKECEQLLPGNQFFRVHHSHIINLQYIVRYVKGRGGYVILEDNSKVDVASSKRDAFLQLYSRK